VSEWREALRRAVEAGSVVALIYAETELSPELPDWLANASAEASRRFRTLEPAGSGRVRRAFERELADARRFVGVVRTLLWWDRLVQAVEDEPRTVAAKLQAAKERARWWEEQRAPGPAPTWGPWLPEIRTEFRLIAAATWTTVFETTARDLSGAPTADIGPFVPPAGEWCSPRSVRAAFYRVRRAPERYRWVIAACLFYPGDPWVTLPEPRSLARRMRRYLS
jgi:hypothetical protein